MMKFIRTITGVAVCASFFIAGTVAVGIVKAAESEPLTITNNSNTNALTIIQNGDVGPGRTRSGALLINNSNNPNAGFTLSSGHGNPTDPLARIEITNKTWDQPILHITSDAETSHGLIRLDSSTPEIEFVETDQDNARGEGKFEVRVQHDQFQINSRRGDNRTFENAFTFTPFREGAKFGIADYSPDASLEIVTGNYPAIFFSSSRDADGDIMEVSGKGDFNLKQGSVTVSSGKVSTFKGGINITDGCLAIDGECITAGDLGSAPAQTTSEPIQTTSSAYTFPEYASYSLDTYNDTHEYMQMDVERGTPPSIDCNSYSEQGRFVLDASDNKIWVCNGSERGWDSIPLQD